MDLLCEDLERHIVGFCDLDSLKALNNVSKAWRAAVHEGQVYEHGPINGTTFSLLSFSQHGPVFMPFVTELQLHGFWSSDDLRNGLQALDLGRGHRKRDMVLDISQKFIENCPADVIAYLQSICWHTIRSDADILDGFVTQNAAVAYQSIGSFKVSNELTTYYFGNSKEVSTIVSAKAFELMPKSIVLYGVLTDEAMGSLPINYNLEHLTLVNEGCCEWNNAQRLQLACPNLESFSILSSNLVARDLDHFNWSLWPKLRSLNVEHNYTLNGHQTIHWPTNLESLYVAYTQLMTPDALPVCKSIKHLSCNLELKKNWFSYIESKQLKALSVHMRQFINESQEYAFWSSLSKIDKISIHHMESYATRRTVKRACPCSLVTKRGAVNIRQI